MAGKGHVRIRATLLLCVLAAAGASAAQERLGLTPPPTSNPTPAFDVATIKPATATDGHSHIWNHAEIGEFAAANVTVKMLMRFAYELPETRLVGGPAWLDSTSFDVQAKTDPDTAARLHALSFNQASVEVRHMVQALLDDRFQLITHKETRQLPAYALVVAKSGARLGALQTSGTTISLGRDHISVQGENSVALLAEQLAKVLGRVVLDQTGIAGRYELKLKWAAENGAEESGASIFTAIQEQLGLKLEAERVPVQVLAVDRAAPPSPN